MSAHDWRDGIGDFCVADHLAELNEVHLVRHSTPNPGCSVVICLEDLCAPDLIDSGFQAQNLPINIPRNNTREANSP
jgi:hypothetical protein